MTILNDNNFIISKCIKIYLSLGALFCMVSVLIGAFAAHGLKAILSEYQMGIINTAAEYQMYHGLALLIASILFLVLGTSSKRIHVVNSTFVVACLLFSGSLYGFAGTGLKTFVFITPLGGLCFIVGWCLLIWVICASPKQIKSTE